jgi:hypothetical protein
MRHIFLVRAMLEYKLATGHTSPYYDSSGKSAISSTSQRGAGGPAAGSADRLQQFPINEFGLAPFNLPNSPMGTKLGGMIGKLFKKSSQDADMFSLAQPPSLRGTIPGIGGSPSVKGPEVC